jgi:hypothetical protein
MRSAAPIVIPRPDPLTVLVPVWCVVWGVIGAALYLGAPSAATGGIPVLGVMVFFVGLALTGGAILCGMWLRSVLGLKIKLGANVALGLLCLVYSAWAVRALGITRPFVIVSLLLTISVASFWQARRLNAVLNPRE